MSDRHAIARVWAGLAGQYEDFLFHEGLTPRQIADRCGAAVFLVVGGGLSDERVALRMARAGVAVVSPAAMCPAGLWPLAGPAGASWSRRLFGLCQAVAIAHPDYVNDAECAQMARDALSVNKPVFTVAMEGFANAG